MHFSGTIPYRPEFSPIELVFGFIKSNLTNIHESNEDSIQQRIYDICRVINMIKPSDCKGFYRHVLRKIFYEM